MPHWNSQATVPTGLIVPFNVTLVAARFVWVVVVTIGVVSRVTFTV